MPRSGLGVRSLGARLALAASLGLAGCVLPLRFIAVQGGKLGDVGGGIFNGPTSSGSAGPGTTSGSSNLTGQLAAPALGLVANNSGSLADVGSGVYLVSDNGAGLVPVSQLTANPELSTQSLVQDDIPQAAITLVDTSGATLSNPVMTSQSGEYQIPAGQYSTQSVASGALGFVRATFGAKDAAGNITNFAFEAPVDLAEAPGATADIDAASTLLSAKLLAARQAGWTGSLTESDIQDFEAQLRDELTLGLLPYMGDTSPDILSTFDQILQDDATISAAASSQLGSTLAAPSDPWQVKTVLTWQDLVNLGIYDANGTHFGTYEFFFNDNVISDAGTMVVDKGGDIFLPGFSDPQSGQITLWKLPRSSQGTYATASPYVVLPSDYTNPVETAVSPTDQLYLASYNQTDNNVYIYKDPGTGSWPWTLVASASVPSDNGLPAATRGSKLVIDDQGNAYLMRRVDKVEEVPAGGGTPQILTIDTPPPGKNTVAPDSLAAKSGGGAYLGDPNTNQILDLAPGGAVTPLIGIPGDTSFQVGRAGWTHLASPSALVEGPDNTLYMADFALNRILRLSPDGSVFTVAGSPTVGNGDGPGPSASFADIFNVDVDGAGNLYVLDYDPSVFGNGSGGPYIRVITPPPK